MKNRIFEWLSEFWEQWNEAFLFPIALAIFFAAYGVAQLFLGPEAGLQPIGYYVGPLFFRPSIFILAGFMATTAFIFNRPHLYRHTMKHIRKVLNPTFQAGGTDKRTANLELDDKWAKRGLFTWLWLYTLAVLVMALANS